MADSNMRCTCGHRVFREHKATTVVIERRWLLFDAGAWGGAGSTPLGTYFGSGPGGAWGNFEVSVTKRSTRLTCESCQRLRSATPAQGIGIFGAYRYVDNIFVMVTSGADLGGLTAVFVGVTTGARVEVSPVRQYAPVFSLAAPAPAVVAPFPPLGARLASAIRIPLPDVEYDDTYTVSLVDSIGGTTTVLTTISLESAVQVHHVNEADLNGLPRSLVQTNLSAKTPVGQPGSGASSGIPFDKCDAVIEYDARFGTLPDAQGWTHAGAGPSADYNLVAGGSLDVENTAGPTYWTKEITLATPADQVHMYAHYRVQTASSADEEGVSFLGAVAPGGSADYEGAQMVQGESKLSYLTLDSATPALVSNRPRASWSSIFTGVDVGAMGFASVEDAPAELVDAGTTWGSLAGGGVNPTMLARFGCFYGDVHAQIRNFAVSAPGRFMRAFFKSFTATSNPVLRLYFASDLDAASSARFKVRYGALGLGNNPYALGALSSSTNAFFTTKNSVVEVAVSLPSLTAGAPFWFTVERDWASVDDATRATLHLLSATVRSS